MNLAVCNILKLMKQLQTSFPLNDPYLANGYRDPRIPLQGQDQEETSFYRHSQTTLQDSHQKQACLQNLYFHNKSSTFINSSLGNGERESSQSNQLKSLGKFSGISKFRGKKQVQNVQEPMSSQLEQQQVSLDQQEKQMRAESQIGEGEDKGPITRALYNKISYLERELQELTKAIQEDAKQSSAQSEQEGYYEELAIQNAQLTIRVQQLEQEKRKLQTSFQKSVRPQQQSAQIQGGSNFNYRKKYEQLRQSHQELLADYEKEHENNNVLKEQILRFQEKINKLESDMEGERPKSSKVNLGITQQDYPADEKNTEKVEQLTQEVENLLEKIHSLNLQLNSEQDQKDTLMEQLNKQNQQFQALRKQLTDEQLKRRDLEEQQQCLKEEVKYLKEELQSLSQVNSTQQKELQEKYIRQQVEDSHRQQQLQGQVKTLQIQNTNLKAEKKKLQEKIHQLEEQAHRSGNQVSFLQKQSTKSSQQATSKDAIIGNLEDQVVQLRRTIQNLQEEHVKENSSSRLSENGLRAEVRILEGELQEERQRQQLLKVKLNEIILSQEEQLSELNSQNRKLILQLRNFKKKEDSQSRDQEQVLRVQLRELQLKVEKDKEVLSRHYEVQLQQLNQDHLKQIQELRKIHARETQQLLNNLRLQGQTQVQRQQNQWQQELTIAQQQITQLSKQLMRSQARLKQAEQELEGKQQQLRELRQREGQLGEQGQLEAELRALQASHEELLRQISLIKDRQSVNLPQFQSQFLNANTYNQTSQIQQRTQNSSLKQQKKTLTAQIESLRSEIDEKKQIIQQMNLQLEKSGILLAQRQQQIAQRQLFLSNLKSQIVHIQFSSKKPQQQSQIKSHPQHFLNRPQNLHGNSNNECPHCPQVIKEFNIYKELMELKLQSMEEVLDQLKLSFTQSQLHLKNDLVRDQSKYEQWLSRYESHDREYTRLMERVWEWEKLQLRNQQISQSNHSYPNLGINRNSHPNPEQNKKGEIKTLKTQNIEPNDLQQNLGDQGHLSDIQYDLYLIKLENSTLRSQIAALEKQLKQQGENPQVLNQLRHLKSFNENLLSQNEDLKRHLLEQSPNPKTLPVSNLFPQTTYEKYSHKAISEHQLTIQSSARSRAQEKALASAQLLISKLKKENDNLIQSKKVLQRELQQVEYSYRLLVKETEGEKEKTRRQFENFNRQSRIESHKLPAQYLKTHPQHKKLQGDYIALKRVYLELQLENKKQKEFSEEELQKLKIQNDFHREKIRQLQKGQKEKLRSTFFSFNPEFKVSSSGETQNRNKILEERVIYLQRQVEKKTQECQQLIEKYEAFLQESKNSSRQPNQGIAQKSHRQRLSNLVQKLDVALIESPKWEQSEVHQAQQLDQQVKIIHKLIDQKLIELEITPRTTDSVIDKVKWIIGRLTAEVKSLKNNIEILKGQKRVIMKQRNTLKERLSQLWVDQAENLFQNLSQHQEEQFFSQKLGLNQAKLLQGHQSVPRLNLNENRLNSNENNENEEKALTKLSDAGKLVNQALQLKQQRRSGLERFQQRMEKLST